MSDSTPCWCPKLHLQGPEPLHEEGTYRSFVEFRGHYTLPWEVFRGWESKWPTDLRLTDASLAELKGEKCDLEGGAKCNLKADQGCDFTRGCVK